MRNTILACIITFGVAWFAPQLLGLNKSSAVSMAVEADSVQDYLDLTNAQQQQLEELSKNLREKAKGSIQELESKQKALRTRLASDDADPLAAGKALIELEFAKRKSEQTSEELRAEALKVLTPEQRAKLTVLEQAAKLRSLTRQAEGLFLIAPPSWVTSGSGPLGMYPAKKRVPTQSPGPNAT